MATVLTADDLDDLRDDALDSPEPAKIAARLVSAVDSSGLADPDDAALALAYAADILRLDDRTDEALRVAERAVALSPAGAPHIAFSRVTYAATLFTAQRRDDAVATLETLRPLHRLDHDVIDILIETLHNYDCLDLAHVWLTEAVQGQKEVMAGFPEGDASVEAFERMDLLFTLLAHRHDVREDLDLEHDEDDELADELQEAMDEDDEADTLLFWPRDAYTELTTRWPDLTVLVGADWDQHRTIVERLLTEYDEEGSPAPDLIAGSIEGLLAHAAEEGHEPNSPEAQIGYASIIDGPGVAWPPARNELCWCGSGDKYKKCCLPRSRESA